MPVIRTHAAFPRGFCLALVLLGLGLKFWLTAESEIVDDDHDPSEYVLQILYPENGGVGYGPGTGAFARLFYVTGVPYRVGVELAYIFAVSVVLKSLFLAWPGERSLTTFLFLLALFDPVIMELFSRIWSDEVWMIETMLGFALAILAVREFGAPRWYCLLPAAVVLGYSTITRTVVFPLTAALLVLTGLGMAFLLTRTPDHSNRDRPIQFILAMWSLLLGIAMVYLGTCVYDAKKFGFYGISAPDSAEYRTFYLCLQSVGEPTGDAYFPIDAGRRKLIAQAGPRAKWLMSQLDHDVPDHEGGLSRSGKYDIPAGLFHWAVFHGAQPVTHGDLRATFALFREIEKEVHGAGERGTFKVAPVWPLPDRRLGTVLGVFPEQLGVTLNNILYEPPVATIYCGQSPAMYENPDFTAALHRRTVHPSPFRDRIWNGLSVIYAGLYTRAAFYLFLAVVFFSIVLLVRKGDLCVDDSVPFLLRQLYLIIFFVMFVWYSFFAASGVAEDTRYLILNHLLLPMLLAYYILQIVRWLKDRPA